MTTPPRLLADRVGNGPIIIQKINQTEYSESDTAVIQALIATESVEGVGPRSGRIRFLRMLTDEDTALNLVAKRLREVAETESGKSGWLAPPNVIDQDLSDGLSCYTHRSNTGLLRERFSSTLFNPELRLATTQHRKLFPPVRHVSGDLCAA